MVTAQGSGIAGGNRNNWGVPLPSALFRRVHGSAVKGAIKSTDKQGLYHLLGHHSTWVEGWVGGDGRERVPVPKTLGAFCTLSHSLMPIFLLSS